MATIDFSLKFEFMGPLLGKILDRPLRWRHLQIQNDHQKFVLSISLKLLEVETWNLIHRLPKRQHVFSFRTRVMPPGCQNKACFAYNYILEIVKATVLKSARLLMEWFWMFSFDHQVVATSDSKRLPAPKLVLLIIYLGADRARRLENWESTLDLSFKKVAYFILCPLTHCVVY